MADYNAAIRIDPKAIYAYSNRGAIYQRKGDFARAAADYGEVTRLQPNNLDAWSARCWVRAVSPGQTQQALTDCNQALAIKARRAGRARHPRLRPSQARPDRQRHQGLRCGAEARSQAGRLAVRPRHRQAQDGRPGTAATPTSPPPRRSRPTSPANSPATEFADAYPATANLIANSTASTTTAGFASAMRPDRILASRVGDEAEPDAGGDRIGQRHRDRGDHRRALLR